MYPVKELKELTRRTELKMIFFQFSFMQPASGLIIKSDI